MDLPHKLLIDECVPKIVSSELISAGIDLVFSVNEAGQGATDEEVFSTAQKLNRAIFTIDRGFGDIFRFEIGESAGVIVFLLNNLSKQELMEIPRVFLSEYHEPLAGKLTIIGKRRVRILNR